MRILIDMNLSPEWVAFLAQHGVESVHWTSVGDPAATDRILMAWALENRHVVFTHDLDFGTLLALTHKAGPSVIQTRGDDVMPETLGAALLATLRQFATELTQGALVTVDERRARVRILPL